MLILWLQGINDWTVDSLQKRLSKVVRADCALLDRWRFSQVPAGGMSAQSESKTFTNYLDFGLAATIALDFHNALERGELADLGRSANKNGNESAISEYTSDTRH